MFVLELAFDDNPERLAARPAHRDFLTSLHSSGELFAAGPWSDDSGALLVFDTERERLNEILAADPYYSLPGVRVVSVRHWAPVIGVAAVSPAD